MKLDELILGKNGKELLVGKDITGLAVDEGKLKVYTRGKGTVIWPLPQTGEVVIRLRSTE